MVETGHSWCAELSDVRQKERIDYRGFGHIERDCANAWR